MWSVEPWHWLVFGLILITLELFLPTFAIMWFGAAAVAVAVVAWLLPIGVFAQVIVWLLLSVAFMAAWFYWLRPWRLARQVPSALLTQAMGEVGMVIVKPMPQKLGTVRFSVPVLGAEEWPCRNEVGELNEGDRVQVTGVGDGHLVVAPLAPLPSPTGVSLTV